MYLWWVSLPGQVHSVITIRQGREQLRTRGRWTVRWDTMKKSRTALFSHITVTLHCITTLIMRLPLGGHIRATSRPSVRLSVRLYVPFPPLIGKWKTRCSNKGQVTASCRAILRSKGERSRSMGAEKGRPHIVSAIGAALTGSMTVS